jgi:hypothetical protein
MLHYLQYHRTKSFHEKQILQYACEVASYIVFSLECKTLPWTTNPQVTCWKIQQPCCSLLWLQPLFQFTASTLPAYKTLKAVCCHPETTQYDYDGISVKTSWHNVILTFKLDGCLRVTVFKTGIVLNMFYQLSQENLRFLHTKDNYQGCPWVASNKKVTLCLIQPQTMKKYGAVEALLRTKCTGCNNFTLRSLYPPGKRTTCINRIGSLVGPRAGLDVARIKRSVPKERKRTPFAQPSASLHNKTNAVCSTLS